MNRIVAALTASIAMLFGGAAADTAFANLTAGSFVFDGNVRAVAHDPASGATFVGGSFTREQMPTGGGLIVSASGSGEPNPANFPMWSAP